MGELLVKPSKTFLFLTLLVLSRSSFALTSEQEYLAKNLYHECREQAICNITDWQKIAKVAYNRQKAYKKWKFGARCNSIACIVQSKEYTSANKLGKPIKDKEVFERIKKFVLASRFGNWKYLFFSTKGKSKSRKMVYRGNLIKLIGATR
jgi:hypothetical protein